MKVIVFMQKELEDWWGIDDLLEDNADLSIDEQNALILELLMEDVPALTDGATWRFARMDERTRNMDTQWQPIEMAPKIQSREMLVWDRGYAIAHWVDTVGWIGEDWEVIYPTHFMQLPDPPKI